MKPPKTSYFILSFILILNVIIGQIKIGDNPQNLDPSSLLELESSTRTLVISRLTNSQIQLITPLSGALVYNTDENCVFFFDGANWINLCQSQPDQPTDNEPPIDQEPTVGVTIIDNLDGTFAVSTEEGETFLIDTNVHSGEAGAIFFGDVYGEPTSNEANLFWDNQRRRLGIGTNTPKQTLDVEGVIRSSRIFNGMGSSSYPGYHFQDNTSTGMFAILRNILGFSTNGKEVMRLIENGNVGIQVQNPQATLHVGGDLQVDGNIITGNRTLKTEAVAFKTIRRLNLSKEALTLNDETVILEESVELLLLPSAKPENAGVLFILKNLGNKLPLNLSYRDLEGKKMKYLQRNIVVWLQSDGEEWQQIR